MRSLSISLLSLFLICNNATGQTISKRSTPFVLGVTDTIQSAQLGETRILNIYLPDGYSKNDTAKYPVVYLLDGSADEDFVHIVGVVQFLTMIQVMQPTIVVGIGNVDRKRDFTYPTDNKEELKLVPTSGGSAKFMLYVEKDLQPYVQRTYRTNGTKILIGQSLGGLVAAEILLRKPALFNNYIIVSPSLWWHSESLLVEAPALLKGRTNNNTSVFIAVGSEGKQMEDDAVKLVSLLQTNTKYKVQFTPLPKENHLTILHNAVYKAFEFLNGK